jgi:hypothetical protein
MPVMVARPDCAAAGAAAITSNPVSATRLISSTSLEQRDMKDSFALFTTTERRQWCCAKVFARIVGRFRGTAIV